MKIVAEAGTCDGNLAYAIGAAVRAAQAGAWGFKVQLYRKETLFSSTAPSYGKGINRAATQWDDVGELLPYEDWPKVKQVCDDLGIEFFASAWDREAVDALEAMGVNLYKVGSADITHQPLIEHVAKTGKTVVLSTGATNVAEIERAVGWVDAAGGRPPLLLACTLSYPTDVADANISRLLMLKQTFPQCDVGYSDHTKTPETAWVAASLGAEMLEKHFTVTPGAGGDHDFAATPAELAHMVQAAEVAEALFGDPTLEPSDVETAARTNARRSIVARVDIPKGTRLAWGMFAYLRPGTGIPPYETAKIVGPKPMRAMVDIAAGTVIAWNMIGHAGATLTVG